jgi:small subunit ribosomal protein S1
VSHPSRDEFAALLEESLTGTALQEGSVIKGTIVGIEKDVAVIDVGLKTEGRIPLKEFGLSGRSPNLSVGDEVDVYLERVENAAGEAVLSREKARREESWTRLEEKYKAGERVEGVIFNRVKGGFTVDLDGAVAFLPGSQVDIRPIRDVGPLMNVPQPFQILKMDRRRGNIVVSRRSVLEETRAEKRSEIVARLEEGQVIDGVVKNITDYGAFIDLGGIDGLLHVTDMAWRRVNHPSEIVNVGDTVKVQIIRINPETQRISLGIKQLEADPWEGIAAKYPVDSRFKGTVTNITDYGAFVELEPGVEGLIHVSDDQPGGGSPGARSRSRQAPHLAWPEADAGESVGRLCRQPSRRRDHRRSDPQHHRVRPVHRPRWRDRRHGAPVRSRLDQVRRRRAQGLQEGRHRQGGGA